MKKFLAFLLDVFISFVVAGYLIAIIFGQTTGTGGFYLNVFPAILLFVEVILYFTVLRKKLGQTLGRKILGLGSKDEVKAEPKEEPAPPVENVSETPSTPSEENTEINGQI